MSAEHEHSLTKYFVIQKRTALTQQHVWRIELSEWLEHFMAHPLRDARHSNPGGHRFTTTTPGFWTIDSVQLVRREYPKKPKPPKEPKQKPIKPVIAKAPKPPRPIARPTGWYDDSRVLTLNEWKDEVRAK